MPTPPAHNDRPEMPVAWTVIPKGMSGSPGNAAGMEVFEYCGVRPYTLSIARPSEQLHNTAPKFILDPGRSPALHLEDLLETSSPRAVRLRIPFVPELLEPCLDSFASLSCPIVWAPPEPPSQSTSARDDATDRTLLNRVLTQAEVVVLGIEQARLLSGLAITTDAELPAAADRLYTRGARLIIISGPRHAGWLTDCWWSSRHHGWLNAHYQAANPGNDGRFSAALTAALALKYPREDAAVAARAWVNRIARQETGPDEKNPDQNVDLPWLSAQPLPPEDRPRFPACPPSILTFYPIVDRAVRVAALFERGVPVVQLRIKDLHGASLQNEISTAVRAQNRYSGHLFVNDYWREALAAGAWGVHLGQEDLAHADLHAIAAGGLRLGISAASLQELASAWSLRPSLIGAGAVFPTRSKVLGRPPIGLQNLSRIATLSPVPVVAIGGITLESAPAVYQAGADGIAVISDIQNTPDPESRLTAWLDLVHRRGSRPGFG